MEGADTQQSTVISNAKLEEAMRQYGITKDATSPEQQGRYLRRYSPAALIFSVFYFAAMKDWLFAIASIICSVTIVLLPGLLILPIFARRRAYGYKNWASFEEFQEVQISWDKSAIYSLVVLVILTILIGFLAGPSFLNAIHQISPSTSQDNGQNVIQQLNQTKNDFQNVIGN